MQLSQEHGLATATVVIASRILKREGLVIGSTGHGTFVPEGSAKLSQSRSPTAALLLHAASG